MPSDLGQPPYKIYRSGPRGLKERLRGEEDELRVPRGYRTYRGGGRTGSRRRITPKRVILGLLALLVAWLALSFVLFLISSGDANTSVPADAQAELTSGGNMLTSTDTVLILGTDQRPTTGPGSKEPGANHSDAGANSDTIMLWRIGGGVSRRLSIPRDTVAEIPGHGLAKINAGYALGGPALAIKTIQQFAGIPINHVIIVNLGAFPPFIDAIGGVTVTTTDKVCSNISGGTKDGGFTLNLNPGTHHLNGIQALTLARTRENACDPASNDLTREGYQQQILNGVKSQLFSLHTFLHLPWAAWDAPKVLRTDMGGPTLLSLFIASELGGSAPVQILKPTGAEALPGYGDALTTTPQAVHAAVSKLING
ncbi:MAG: LCP family protein [Solirubrobacterales bacterium]|nr:LCP family protein [Solirubrobacterales bacterium]